MSGGRRDILSLEEYHLASEILKQKYYENDINKYFMGIAILNSLFSRDPRTQVGSCIVKDNIVLSEGYNKAIVGMTDEEMPWDSKGEEINDIMNIKNTFVVHAESDAIFSYDGNKSELNEAKIFITLSPCTECTKQIIRCGINEVVYLDVYKKVDLVRASNYMLNKNGIIHRQIDDPEVLKEKVLKIVKSL